MTRPGIEHRSPGRLANTLRKYLAILQTVVRYYLFKIKDVESLLLKFRIIIRKQYLAILQTGCKMVIIKNKGYRVTFIKV